MVSPRARGGVLIGRRLLWVAGGLLAAALLLGALAVGWSATPAGAGFLARQVERQLGGMLATGDLTVGAVRLLPSGVRIEDLRVDGPAQPDWLVVDEIAASVAWSELLERRVHLTALEISRPRLRDDADDGLSGPTLPPANPDGAVTWFPEGWSLTIDAIGLSGGGVALPGLEVRGLVATGGLAMTHETVTLPETTVRFSQTVPAIGAVTVTAEGRIEGPDLASVAVSGEGADWMVRGGGEMPGLFDELGAMSVSLSASAGHAGTRLLAEAFDLAVPRAAPLGTTAVLTVEGPLDDAAIGLRAWRTSEAHRDGPEATPELVASISLRAAEAPVRARFTASTPRALGVDDFGRLDLGGAEGTVVVDGEEVTADVSATLAALDLDGVPFAMAGDVAVRLADRRLEVDARLADRSDPRERVVVRGVADLEASVARFDALEVNPTGEVPWRQDRPTAVRWTSDGLAAVFVDVSSRRGSITFRADDLVRRPFDVDATVADLDLAYVRSVVRRVTDAELPELGGTAQLGLTTDRTPTRPANRWFLDGAVTGLSVDPWLHEATVRLAGRVAPRPDAAVDRLVAEVTAAVDGAQGELASLAASVPVRRRGAADFALRCGEPTARADLGIDAALADLDALVDLPPSVPAEGQITADLVARGDPCDPELELEGAVAAPFADRRVAIDLAGTDVDGALRLHAGLQDEQQVQRLRATVSARHAPLARLARGEVAIADAVKAVEGEATLDGFPSSWLLDTLEGRLDGTATVRGRGMSIDETDGRVVLEPDPSLGIDERVELAWQTADRVVRITGAAVGAEPRLEARLSLDAAPLTLAGRLESTELPLAHLVAITDGALVDGEGRVEAAGTVRGTLDDPEIDAQLDVREGAFTLPSTGVRYQDVEASGHFEGFTLVVDEARASSRPERRGFALLEPGKALTATGSIDLSDGGFRPDLELELDRTWIVATSTTILQVSGEARLNRPQQGGRLLLSGAATVDGGRFETDRTVFGDQRTRALHPDIRFVGDGLAELGPEMGAESEESAIPTTLSAIDLDLDVDFGDGVRLDAAFPLADTAERITATTDASIDAMLRGNVAVSQVDGELDLQGRLDVTGNVGLLTAQFEVTGGSVAFSGGDLTTPQIDLALARETRAYGRVTADVSGTPEDLVISDLSSPEYGSRADIVAILLLGRPIEELEPGRGASSSAAVQSALLAVAGNQVSEVLGTRVVDKVEYDAVEGLSLGWQLGGSGFLTVSVDPLAEEDESTAEAQFTWLFTDHVEAGIETGDAGTGTAWVTWRDRF